MQPEIMYARPPQRALWLRVPVVALSVAGAGLLLWHADRLPEIPAAAGTAPLDPPAMPAWDQEAWRVFGRVERMDVDSPGRIGSRFRLAGTFFTFDGGGRQARIAILDDLRERKQHLVAEEDEMDGIRVLYVFHDRVVLEKNGSEEQLWLSFPGEDKPSAPVSQHAAEAEAAADKPQGFGRQVGDRRWLLSREALMQYYHELLDAPERLVALFESMRPDYDPDGQILGYRLDLAGEAEFFEAVGLREGDAIRRVNSMEMTSHRRAEYFIAEFVQDRASAFVLDIERDGEPLKQIYMVR